MGFDPRFAARPHWQGRPGRRLAWSLLPATLIVAGALTLVPRFDHFRPPAQLTVQLGTPETHEPYPAVPTARQDEPPPQEEPAAVDIGAVTVAEPAPAKPGPAPDWYALLPDAAEAVLDAAGNTVAVNPGFEARRRQAAGQFRPSMAPRERPVWEQVEKDNMGRTLLVSDDCYRVIDDPGVGNRDAFLTFGQYMTSCSRADSAPRELAFVDEIRKRRAGRARSSHPVVE